VKKTRRTEKLIEIHEFYAIRTASGSLPALCTDCTTPDGIMLPPDHAALLSHVPTRVIYRLVETGSIHYREKPDGSLLVCVRTLVAAASSQKVLNMKGDLK